jgi:hypothetical protein
MKFREPSDLAEMQGRYSKYSRRSKLRIDRAVDPSQPISLDHSWNHL